MYGNEDMFTDVSRFTKRLLTLFWSGIIPPHIYTGEGLGHRPLPRRCFDGKV